jgi:integrase
MPKKNLHPHVSWRNGRPRFQPGVKLREAGHVGKDLRHADGRWYSRGEAVDWSLAFQRQLQDAAKAATAARRSSGAPSGGQARSAGAAARTQQTAYTVARMFADWWGPAGNPRFRPGERRAYAAKTVHFYQMSARILEDDHPLIWNAPVTSLKRHMLRAAYEEIWAARGLSSARAAMATLSSAISWAILRGRARRADNPARGLSMEVPDPRVRFATRAEFAALVAAADHLGRPEIGDMAYLGVWTGQRQADRLALQLKAVLNNRRIFRQAKTGAIVAIRQTRELENRLKAAIERRAGARATALLAAKTALERAEVEARFSHAVLNEQSWRPFQASYYTHLFAEIRAVAVAGVKNEDGSWKLEPVKSLADFWEMDLRDTAVVWMALAGATVPEIISVTGHTIESATRILKHYLARHPEMADQAIGKMLAWYDAGGETEIGL